MSQVTKFAGRDPGPAARVTGFLEHLRQHGFRLGVGETELALRAMTAVGAVTPSAACSALRAVCTGSKDEAERFALLFESYWKNGGRVRQKITPQAQSARAGRAALRAWGAQSGTGRGAESGGDGSADASGEGRLVATKNESLGRRDLREIVDPADIARAEDVARALASALRDRRSRRRKAAPSGDRIDFRRVMRHSLARGGEPLDLPRRRRPDRAVRITVLVDVSGSMTVYARVFLAFVAGLLRADPTADAYMFHTRLVRIAETLRDEDPLRLLNRLTLLSEGFGGGSRIAGAVGDLAGRGRINGRSVVVILSDGYDTDPAASMTEAMAALKRRGCRIIWVNPLLGWQDYAPVAAGMAAALPYLDHFAAANTLNAISDLARVLARL